MSIRTLLLLLVLAVWLPAVVGFSLLARSTYLREAEDARQDVERIAQSLNLLVERELDNRVVIAKTLGASRSLADGDLRRFHDEALQATQGSGNWVVLVDPTRGLVNTLTPFDEGKPFPRAPGAPFVSGTTRVAMSMRGTLTPLPFLAAYAPDLNSHPPRYNVAVSFTPEVVQSVIDRENSPGRLASVLNEQQIIVARSRDPQKWIGKLAGEEVQRRARANRGSFAESVTLDGVPSLTYVSVANRHGWNVVLALPQTALTGSARRLTFQALAAAGVLLAFGLVIAIVAARRIATPIIALRQAAIQLGQDQVPDVLSTGVLEANEVSRALEAAGRRAHDATRTLESKVAQAVGEARQAQAALLEGQKLEAIGRLTGGLAHDFNNVLQTISTALYVLNRNMQGDSPHRRYVDAAIRASTKAADLVKQMMSFGRAQPLNPRSTDLRQLVLQSQELTRKAVGERIRITADFAPGLPAVFVDPVHLELALLNIFFNARDAMPMGGAITITARMATADEIVGLDHADHVCLQIRDDGAGMNEETRNRAFEPYFTTKPIGAGSGLGLSQVMSFAQQSKGAVRLDSEVGAGTRIRLVLPVSHDAVAATASAQVSVGTASRRLQILMVEDDALVSSVVVPILRDAGHEVTLCENADSALDVLRARTDFAVLFTDIVMPGKLTGLDLVDWCQAHTPHIAVVVATGYSSQQSRAGVAELRKPYAFDEMLAALQRAVEAAATSGADRTA